MLPLAALYASAVVVLFAWLEWERRLARREERAMGMTPEQCTAEVSAFAHSLGLSDEDRHHAGALAHEILVFVGKQIAMLQVVGSVDEKADVHELASRALAIALKAETLNLGKRRT
jgi:hypothetical protein